MKAKEYFEKYGPRIADPDNSEYVKDAITELVNEMCKEQKKTMDIRHIKTDHAAEALIHEFNQKWNAICHLFEKKFGASPLLHDGWILLMNKYIFGKEIKNNVDESNVSEM